MNRIFGTSSSKKPRPTLQDAISSTDTRMASIEVKIKKLDGELARYKEQMGRLRNGPGKNAIQERALRTLKQKRMYESQLAQLTQQTFNMDWRTRSSRSSTARSTLTRSRFVAAVHYDMEDLLEQANEIQESLGRSYAVPDEIDEADLQAELDALELDAEEEGPSYLSDLNKMPDFVDEPPVEIAETPSEQKEAVKTTV
ncbi:vacuolar protein sorting-associated protein 60 [Epithele typhae]|uniref:vacuolar protein sorting-associated protein 60 n=1 Tax=Epithele typhae TaxID=378194 RepID=UPI002008D707|nr:vacuolar protein sorting-associated protein 60 [Epithele typhae]KAH9943280.1 vacuolar protein sorting-associated protein 60 [Epithele typhae]